MIGRGADEFGIPDGLVAEGDLGSLGAADDVVVGDDVPLVVPDEARAGAAGDGEQVEAKIVAADVDAGDVIAAGSGQELRSLFGSIHTLQQRGGGLLARRADRVAQSRKRIFFE